MENEKFQDLVLNHLAKLTQDITELKSGQQRLESRMESMESRMESMESRMESMESRMDGMESRMDGMESRMKCLETKVDLIQTQTAELVEFKIEATQKLDRLMDDVEFIKHKEHLNEEELFRLKTNIKVVK